LTAYSELYNRICGRKAWAISKQELAKLYSNKSITQIANEYSVSTASVWNALKRYNIAIRSKSSGLKISWKNRSKAPLSQGNWKGGHVSDGKGYVLIYQKNDPRTIKKGYVYEHVLNWEKAHNQPVPKGYIIHHLNGVRDDNCPENLALLPSKQAHSTWTIIQLLQKRIRELEPNTKEIVLLPCSKTLIGKRYYDREYVRVYAPDHPRGKHGYVFEHIINWEKANKKEAPLTSIIHHLNGIKDDNRPENLKMIPSRQEHTTWTIVNLQRQRIKEIELKQKESAIP
jgi:hypothetical protein